jgi:drug/metabolite transporter (DMT)-like permease
MTASPDKDTLYKGYIDAFLTILIWSGFVIVSRMGGKSPLLPYDVVALRFGTATIILLPFWIIKNRVNLLQGKMFMLAMIGGIGYTIPAYLGFKYANAAHGSILLSGIMPFEITLFSWLLLNEHPTRWRLVGLALIALGVASLALNTFRYEAASWIGDAAFIVASMLWALYTVLVRKWKISVWDVTVGNALISAALYLPIYFLFLPKQIMAAPLSAIAMQSFYQGFMAVIVAMILYIRAIIALGPSKVGLCMAMVPAISGVGASLLLDEPLSLLVGMGLALTSLGAWIGNKK